MININLNVLDRNSVLENELEKVLQNQSVQDELRKTLNDTNMLIKLSLEDGKTIKAQNVTKDELIKEVENTKDTKNNSNNNVVQSKNELNVEVKKPTPLVKKILKSAYKIGEEFIDSSARRFLKKKYKLNYSVYNDGKKAIIAATQKDLKNFLKSGTDALLYTAKKIPAETKKVIKNTKNVAIDEVFSWKQEA